MAVEMKNASVLHIGDEFSSIEELEAAIQRLGKEHNVVYFKRDSRTLQAASKRAKVDKINPALKYYSVVWICHKGGRQYVSTATKRRTKTKKEGCNSTIVAHVTKDGQKLVVTQTNFFHSHSIPEDSEWDRRIDRKRRRTKNLRTKPRFIPPPADDQNPQGSKEPPPCKFIKTDSEIPVYHPEPTDSEEQCGDFEHYTEPQNLLSPQVRESCLGRVMGLLREAGRVATSAEDTDLLVLQYALQGFIQRNSPKGEAATAQCYPESQEKRMKTLPPQDDGVAAHDQPGVVVRKQSKMRVKEEMKVKEEVRGREAEDDALLEMDGEMEQVSNRRKKMKKTYMMAFILSKEESLDLSQILPRVLYAGLGLYRMMVGTEEYESCTKEWEDRGEKQKFFYVENAADLVSLHRFSCKLGFLSCLIHPSVTSSSVLGVFLEEALADNILSNLELISS